MRLEQAVGGVFPQPLWASQPQAAVYQALADLVLLVHAAVVLFVVGGLVLVVLGNAKRWHWVNATGFRAAHLVAIAVVALQAWAGVVCPLTTLESWLRVQGGLPGYNASFVEHWVQRLLFYEAPAWVFTWLYSAFAAAVAATWWRYPPARAARADAARECRAATAAAKTESPNSSNAGEV